MVDEFLKRHGNEDGGSYFLGSTYSAAETLTTPFLARSLVSLPATRDIDVLAIAEEKGLDRFVRWVKVWRHAVAFLLMFCQGRDMMLHVRTQALDSSAQQWRASAQASLERQSNVNTGPSKELIIKGAEKWVVKF